jgi:hypothetical protein
MGVQMFLPTPLFGVPSQNIYITYTVYSTTILWSIIMRFNLLKCLIIAQ